MFYQLYIQKFINLDEIENALGRQNLLNLTYESNSCTFIIKIKNMVKKKTKLANKENSMARRLHWKIPQNIYRINYSKLHKLLKNRE